MPDPDVVRRAFLLDHAPAIPPPGELIGPGVLPRQEFPPMRVLPPRFEPPAIRAVVAGSREPDVVRRASIEVASLLDAFRNFARALAAAVRSIVETFQRAFPAPLLVEFAAGAKHYRRMEAHRHRTAGRPRSRMRPGRRRR